MKLAVGMICRQSQCLKSRCDYVHIYHECTLVKAKQLIAVSLPYKQTCQSYRFVSAFDR